MLGNDDRRAGRRRWATVVALLAMVAAGLLLGSATASAHALLERTSPSADAVVAAAPSRVTLAFSEAVTLLPSAVRVYDSGLHRVDAGPVDRVAGDPSTAAVRLRPGLAEGTYSVTWRVVSADSHPVEGGFRFSVGRAGAAAPVVDSPPSTALSGVLLGIARFAEYTGLALAGGYVVLGWLLRTGAATAVLQRSRRPVVAGWWLLLLGTAAAFLLLGPDAVKLPVTFVGDPAVLTTTLATSAGLLALVRLGALVLLGSILSPTVRGARPPAPGPSAVAAGAAVAVVATFSLGGHAGVGSWAGLGVVADAAHLLAMALWAGGVVALSAAMWTGRSDPDTAGAVAAVLPRFSRLAQVAVVVVVLTGLYQTWRNVEVPGALIGTAYGWILLVKLALVIVLLLVGNRARITVARRFARPRRVSRRPTFALSTARGPAPAPAEPEQTPQENSELGSEGASVDVAVVRGLRRGLLAEVAIMAVVLAVTSVLVATPQAAERYAPPFHDTQSAGLLVLDTRVDAAHTGSTTVHLSGHDRSGRPLPLELVDGSLSLPAQQIGPLPLAPAGGAGELSIPVTFAVPGRWAADVTVASPGTSPTLFRIEIPVR